MARASRSSKKLPAFDPSELSDLIFSPAVGRGVGSHLLETVQPAPSHVPPSPLHTEFPGNTESATTVDRYHLSPVVISNPSTVDHYDVSTEASSDSVYPPSSKLTAFSDTSDIASGMAESPSLVMPTVDMSPSVHLVDRIPQDQVLPLDLSTVDSSSSVETCSKEQLEMSTVDTCNLSTDHPSPAPLQILKSEVLSHETIQAHEESAADAITSEKALNLSTVDRFKVPTEEALVRSPFPQGKTLKIWVTEQGEIVPQGRVKRIGPAQDVLNSAEEAVYDTLWTAKLVPHGGEEYARTVQAGYHYLAKKTRLSKKTIQRIVDKLIQKGFIEIEQHADIYARTSTIYRVFSYSAVKERQRRKNRLYVAKIGPGFTYVYEHASEYLSTVDRSAMTIGVTHSVTTDDNRTTVTVVQRSLSTVVRPTTTDLGRNVLDKTPSSGVHEALSEYGPADDDAVRRLFQKCRQAATDCTEEEVVHFIHQKGALIRGKGSEIYSPIGFLVTAVPKCFSGESFRLYREEQRRRRDAEAAEERQRQKELEDWRREQEQRLADPEVAEDEKRLIRECLGVRP